MEFSCSLNLSLLIYNMGTIIFPFCALLATFICTQGFIKDVRDQEGYVDWY